jgi:hypothetical protein
VDLWEVNEAFAVVAMAPMKELGMPHDNLNVNGGACALGHPIGASGARIVVTCCTRCRPAASSAAVATLCIGGGEATAGGGDKARATAHRARQAAAARPRRALLDPASRLPRTVPAGRRRHV